MPGKSADNRIPLTIAKTSVSQAFDRRTGLAMAEAVDDALAALFRAGSRGRLFRIESRSRDENAIAVEAIIETLTASEATLNGQTLSFNVLFNGFAARRRVVATDELTWTGVPVDPSQRFIPWAAGIMRDAVRRDGERFVARCERVARP